MANEAVTSGMTDILLAEAQAGLEVLLLLGDRNNFANHPALYDLGDANSSGSTVGQVSLAGLDGTDEMAAVSEASAVSNTAITTARAAVTVARQALRYETSDLLHSVSHMGIFDAARLAQSMVGSAMMRLCSLYANILDDFTTIVGSTGVNMSVGDWYDAKIALILSNVNGPYASILHGQQFGDFLRDLRTEGGSTQWQPATAALQVLKGGGAQGTFDGVDIFTSSKVPTANAGADRAGSMFGRGAVGHRTASFKDAPRGGPGQVVMAGWIMTVFQYASDTALQRTVGNAQVGVVKIEDLRGVTITTDA
jgi:hypothetical protein